MPVWLGGSRVRVTDPAKTIVDVVADPVWGDGIRSVAEMFDEFLHRNDRDDAKLVEHGDLVGNGAMFKRLGYLLERTGAPLGALVDACRARRTSGINDLDPSVNAGGPILSARGIAETPPWAALPEESSRLDRWTPRDAMPMPRAAWRVWCAD